MHVSPQGRKAAAVLGLGQRMTYGQGGRFEGQKSGAAETEAKLKGVQNFSVQDASAALPQNCQTTIRILGCRRRGVNVTSVIGAGLMSNPGASARRNHDE